MFEPNIYVSSDGTRKDVTKLNTEYLINALAKANREIYNSKETEQYIKYSNNIEVLTNELARRNSEFYIKLVDKENDNNGQ